MYRRTKKPCSLLQLCLRYVSRNLDMFKHSSLSEIIECLPYGLKNGLLEKRARLAGFHDDGQLKTLLNRQTLNLNLSASTITDQTLENIATHCLDLRQLKMTDGTYAFTTAGLLATLPKLRALQEIFLQNSDQMTDEVLACIAANCPRLVVLDVGRSGHLTDKCIDYIADMQLTHLNLSHSKITDAALTKLAASECGRHLVDLNISYCKVSSTGLSQLNWERIQYIGFEGCEIVGEV
jgi:Leucine Rich repeat